MKGKKRLKFIAVPLFIGAILFVLSFIVMHLWNFSIAKAANLNEINFWQAMGLLVLSKILFGFGLGGRRKPWMDRRKWYEKSPPFTEEQKKAFKNKWKEHCRPGSSNE
jgi:hypothetical protein